VRRDWTQTRSALKGGERRVASPLSGWNIQWVCYKSLWRLYFVPCLHNVFKTNIPVGYNVWLSVFIAPHVSFSKPHDRFQLNFLHANWRAPAHYLLCQTVFTNSHVSMDCISNIAETACRHDLGLIWWTRQLSVVWIHVFGSWSISLDMSQWENFHPTLLLVLSVSGKLVSINSSVCGAQ
jgi:hypothetical protein